MFVGQKKETIILLECSHQKEIKKGNEEKYKLKGMSDEITSRFCLIILRC
jgi:hypothetical protein